MRRLLEHPLHPRAFQVLTIILLAAIVAALFLGPPTDEGNPGAWILWYLWWPLLPVTFILLGRLWCAWCPVGFLSDLAQRILPKGLAWPESLRGRELGLLAAVFVAVHLLNLRFGFEEDIPAGRTFLLTLLGLSLAAAVAFRGRAWCRALCPLGAMAALLGAMAPVRIRSAPNLCRSQCGGSPCREGVPGLPGCPLLEDPARGIDPRFCNLCGDCLELCPHHSLSVVSEPGWMMYLHPGLGWQTPAATAVLAGLGLDMALRHLTDWPVAFWQLTSRLGIPATAWAELLLHLLLILALPAWFLLLSLPRRSAVARFNALAVPLLPLGAAALVAMGLRPLLIAGPMNLKTILLSAGFDWARPLDAVRHLDGRPLQLVQSVVVVVGLAMSGREARRQWPAAVMGRGRRAAALLTWAALAAALLWLFSRPMVT